VTDEQARASVLAAIAPHKTWGIPEREIAQRTGLPEKSVRTHIESLWKRSKIRTVVRYGTIHHIAIGTP
jgi:DNA-binding NarL/FixJ family response regulator